MARNRLVWLLSLAILSVPPVGATFHNYTTLAEWRVAATQAGATINFDGSIGSHLTLPIGGVTFTSPREGFDPYWMWVVNGSSGWENWGTTSILRTSDVLYPLKATLATPVTAFAALMGINGPTGHDMNVKVRSGGTVVWQQSLATSAYPVPTFFGIVSTNPAETFDSVTFTPTENYAFLDNVMLGSANQEPPPPPPPSVPEMGTGVLSLCGGILLAVGGCRKRLKPSQKA